jgi:urease accessory protein
MSSSIVSSPHVTPTADRQPLAAGLLDLAFEAGAAGHTVLVRRRQRFPLRLTVPLYPDPHDRGMAFVVVQNPTGALFAGDRLSVSLDVGDGARVHVTTQSATRAVRMDGGEAEQSVELRLGAGAYVELVPGTLIPQAGARVRSRVRGYLDEGATLVASEVLAPGRVACAELFAYDRVELATEVLAATGTELAIDRVVLEPGSRSPGCRGLLGGSRYLGTVLVVAPGGRAAGLSTRVDARLQGLRDVQAAAGELPGGAGVLVRALGEQLGSVRSAVDAAWAVAREAVLGLPLPPRLR